MEFLSPVIAWFQTNVWVWYTLLAIATVVLIHFIQDASYRNGLCDGYGHCREPWNPGYRRAGDLLRSFMSHRWPELNNVISRTEDGEYHSVSSSANESDFGHHESTASPGQDYPHVHV